MQGKKALRPIASSSSCDRLIKAFDKLMKRSMKAPFFNLLGIVAILQPCQAAFCPEWCIEPFCTCQDIFPGLRSFFENALGVQSVSSSPLSDCFPQSGSCLQGFSGRECRCPFSRTNIADDSWLIPDSLKGSLVVTKTASATGSLLAGTWQAGYEASMDNPSHFTSWFSDSEETENVWSVGKTASGNELIGSHSWIRLKRPGESDFTQVLGVGTQGGFVITGNQVYAGTFDGLYISSDEGETWTKAPTDCESYNFPNDPSTPPPGTNGPPRPPSEAKYCEAPVMHMFLLDDGSLIAFYMDFAGAHQIRLQNGDDPLLVESWVAFPSFQETQTCQSMFCHPYDAAILDDYLYVAFQSLSMVRINLTTRQAWEDLTVGNNLTPTAMTTANNGARLIVATSDGFYQTSDGTSWTRISDDACSGRNKPPLMGKGMVEVQNDKIGGTTIVFGTVLGPWVYKE